MIGYEEINASASAGCGPESAEELGVSVGDLVLRAKEFSAHTTVLAQAAGTGIAMTAAWSQGFLAGVRAGREAERGNQ